MSVHTDVCFLPTGPHRLCLCSPLWLSPPSITHRWCCSCQVFYLIAANDGKDTQKCGIDTRCRLDQAMVYARPCGTPLGTSCPRMGHWGIGAAHHAASDRGQIHDNANDGVPNQQRMPNHHPTTVVQNPLALCHAKGMRWWLAPFERHGLWLACSRGMRAPVGWTPGQCAATQSAQDGQNK